MTAAPTPPRHAEEAGPAGRLEARTRRDAWKTYLVKVGRRLDSELYTGRSRSAVRYAAFQDYRECRDVTFAEFLRMVRIWVTAAPEPPIDGYDYIRRNYGFAGRIGSRVRLRNEGPAHNGREGTVVYPGRSTAHVRCVLDGERHVSSVHPDSVEVVS